MGRTSGWVREYRSLGLLLVLVAVLTAAVISSCGSGGSNADGGLCSQCGDDPDGPCHTFVNITPGENGVHCNSEARRGPQSRRHVSGVFEMPTEVGQRATTLLSRCPRSGIPRTRTSTTRCAVTARGPAERRSRSRQTLRRALPRHRRCRPSVTTGSSRAARSAMGTISAAKSCATFTCTDPFGGNGLSCDSFACTIIVSGCIGICSLTP